jgi:heptosyltransferase II
MKIINENIRNILVVRNDRFGEFLLNLPALRALRETFANAKIILVVDPGVAELAATAPYVDEVLEWSANQKHLLKEKIALFQLLKKKKINIAIMLNPSKEFNILSWLLGIPIRAGYDRKSAFLLTHRLEDKKSLGEKHEREYNLEMVRVVGAQTQDPGLSLNIDESFVSKVAADIGLAGEKTLVALHPWTSDPVKEWPSDKFKLLAGKLIYELGLSVVLVGGKQEESRAAAVFSGFGPQLINATGKTSLLELAAVLRKCKLLVSCDSGPVHLAACVDTSVLAIFRSDLPGKTAKRWGPLSGGSAVIEKNSLSDITVEEVFLKVGEMLK